MKKRGFNLENLENKYLLPLIIIFILIVLFFYSTPSFTTLATLNLSLPSTNIGLGQGFPGFIILNIDEPIPSDSKIEVYINDEEVTEKNIKSILDQLNLSYNLIQGTYTATGLTSNALLTFPAINSSILIGVSLPKNSIVRDSTLTLVGSEGVNTVYFPRIDVGDDGVIDWIYLNSFVSWNDVFTYPETSNLEQEFASIYIPGNGYTGIYNLYCEAINLPVSKKFQISSKYEWIDEDRPIMFAAILDEDNKEIETCSLPRETQKDWYSCTLTLENPVMDNYLVCVYINGGLSNTYYTKLSYYTNGNTSGYLCSNTGDCEKTDNEYFIKIKDGIYSRLLTTGTYSKDFNKTLNEFLETCTTYDGENCIVPIKILSDTPGSLNVIDLSIVHTHEGITTGVESYYTNVITSGSLLNFDQVEIPLAILDFKAPSDLGKYTLKIKIPNLNLEQTINFNTTTAPIAIISPMDRIINLNSPVTFDASQAYAINKSIISYIWDFGDGTREENKTLTHTYDEVGTYRVKLIVIDEGNVYSAETSNSTIIIQVVAPFELLSSLLQETKLELSNTINNFKNLSISEKEIVNLLDLDKQLINAKDKLNLIEIEFNQTLNLNETEREKRAALILQDLNKLRDSTVKSFFISSEITSYPSPGTTDLRGAISLFTPSNIDDLVIINEEILTKIEIQSDIKVVDLNYLLGRTEKLTLVKETISTNEQLNDILIVENIPQGLDIDIKTKEFSKIDNKNSLQARFDTFSRGEIKTITYTIEGDHFEEAQDITTVVIYNPDIITSACGNGFCEENELETCPEDCHCFNKEKDYDETGIDCGGSCLSCKSYISIIIIFVIIILAVVVYFYIQKIRKKPALPKKPSLFKPLRKRIEPRRLFKSNKELINLQNYVKSALNRKLTKQQIRKILVTKGWKPEQVDYVLKRVK